ncbi:glycerophosphodiester phosphodiesterase [Fodinicurvata sp. EGI_FJ10296]|uniref:glycerophosphodiester phosphodiesterase n=1 Tax=Fodinicurvata sp. EGI_FJ10296 TaxID=3231908 RepID=UPI0034531417
MPRRRTHPYLSASGPIAFAHRGGTDEAPENTIAAFDAAVRAGYTYLETDVHATRDGVLIAFHDETLDRVTDSTGRVADMDWSEIRTATIQGHPIPLFEDLVASFPDARFNIDPKSDRSADLLGAELERLDVFERVCVGSFSDTRLARLRHRFGARLCTSMGPADVARLRLKAWRLPVQWRSGADCAQVPRRYWGLPVVDAAFVDQAHAVGVPVHVWTINDAAAMERLLDLGVDGIMTDHPSMLRDIMIRRGVWTGS